MSDNNGIEYTNEEIRLMTIRAAQNMIKLGLVEGDVIGFMASNHHHLAPIVFGTMAIGCPINPLDPSFGRSEIVHMFDITRPKLIVCDLENVDVMRNCLNELGLESPIFSFDESTTGSHSAAELLIATNEEETFV